MFLPDSASLDLKTRWVIMSAILYYRHASPVLHDAYYDRLTQEIARAWQSLDPFRQWQLGSLEDFQATGSHIKVTTYAESAAMDWHLRAKGLYPQGLRVGESEWRQDIRCRWVHAEPAGITIKKQARRKPVAAPRPQQLRLF